MTPGVTWSISCAGGAGSVVQDGPIAVQLGQGAGAVFPAISGDEPGVGLNVQIVVVTVQPFQLHSFPHNKFWPPTIALLRTWQRIRRCCGAPACESDYSALPPFAACLDKDQGFPGVVASLVVAVLKREIG